MKEIGNIHFFLKYKAFFLVLTITIIGCGLKVSAQNKLRVISYNILEGMKMDSTQGKQVFVDWIKSYDPDIMALQECNKFTQASLEEMAHKYGHPYAIIDKEKGYPVGITSKYPIVDVRKVTDNMTHGFIVCRIKDLNVIVLHLNPHQYVKRREEIQTVLSYIAASREKKKWIIMGDFNSVSPLDKDRYEKSDLLAHLIELQQKNALLDNLVGRKELDYEVQQRVLDFGLKDAYYEKDTAKEYKGTRIDYIYVSKDLLPEVTNVHFLFDAFTAHHSDHHPVLIEFNHKR